MFFLLLHFISDTFRVTLLIDKSSCLLYLISMLIMFLNLEVMFGSRVPLHEHVVRNDAHAHLSSPHGGPRDRVVVHVIDERSLGPDARASHLK